MQQCSGDMLSCGEMLQFFCMLLSVDDDGVCELLVVVGKHCEWYSNGVKGRCSHSTNYSPETHLPTLILFNIP